MDYERQFEKLTKFCHDVFSVTELLSLENSALIFEAKKCIYPFCFYSNQFCSWGQDIITKERGTFDGIFRQYKSLINSRLLILMELFSIYYGEKQRVGKRTAEMKEGRI